jgi:hypothetical protein
MPSSHDLIGRTLCAAARQGDRSRVARLLAAGASPLHELASPVVWALRAGFFDRFDPASLSGATPAQRNAIAAAAATSGALEWLQWAQPTTQDEVRAAFRAAIVGGHAAAIAWMSPRLSVMGSEEREDCWNGALTEVIFSGSLERLKTLVDAWPPLVRARGPHCADVAGPYSEQPAEALRLVASIAPMEWDGHLVLANAVRRYVRSRYAPQAKQVLRLALDATPAYCRYCRALEEAVEAPDFPRDLFVEVLAKCDPNLNEGGAFIRVAQRMPRRLPLLLRRAPPAAGMGHRLWALCQAPTNVSAWALFGMLAKHQVPATGLSDVQQESHLAALTQWRRRRLGRAARQALPTSCPPRKSRPNLL